MTKDREFTFGKTFLGGKKCPAAAAGYDPAQHAVPATQFDELVHQETGNEFGFVDEETSKRNWLRAIEEADLTHVQQYGRKVAHELGWLDDD